jgi:hypothetical protein
MTGAADSTCAAQQAGEAGAEQQERGGLRRSDRLPVKDEIELEVVRRGRPSVAHAAYLGIQDKP